METGRLRRSQCLMCFRYNYCNYCNEVFCISAALRFVLFIHRRLLPFCCLFFHFVLMSVPLFANNTSWASCRGQGPLPAPHPLNCITSESVLLVRKFSFKNTELGAGSRAFGDLEAKVEILSSRNVLRRRFEAACRKIMLQLPLPTNFFQLPPRQTLSTQAATARHTTCLARVVSLDQLSLSFTCLFCFVGIGSNQLYRFLIEVLH